jgi:hypothetical protein
MEDFPFRFQVDAVGSPDRVRAGAHTYIESLTHIPGTSHYTVSSCLKLAHGIKHDLFQVLNVNAKHFSMRSVRKELNL